LARKIGRAFGPVLGIMSVASDKEAIALANETYYRIQTSLFTSNVTNAHRLARSFQAGTVSANCYGEGGITTPFGDYKTSVFDGWDNAFMHKL
jgi:gamma-glutamyl-gamma-aminobutyraldehyde dehydrogenase|tara:strand:- start:25 stop:303 length:279 start_codon:yes stop_codon:yes gene_type:complete